MGTWSRRKWINTAIKLVIFILVSWVIYKQVFLKKDIDAYWSLFLENVGEGGFPLLLLVAVLMFVNWGLEAYKWQLLIKKIEDLSFLKSFQAIMSGVTLAIFTPNRIGEYGGRIFYLDKADKIEGIAITLIGSYAQIAITLIAGILGLIVLAANTDQFNVYLAWISLTVSLLLIALILTSYFNIWILYHMVHLIPFLKWALKYLRVYYHYSFKELLRILSLSVLRYSVFTLQYWLLLQLFGIKIALLDGAIMIAVIFLTQTILPSIAVIDWIMRGEVAVYFFQSVSDNMIGIVAASYSLWLINLIFPAIIGLVLISRLNFLSFQKA